MSSTSTLSIYPPPPSCPPPPSTPQTLYPCPSPTHTIPHTFHFIWLGSPLPSVHATNIAQWQHLNPESDVVTHTDSTLHSLLPTFPLSIQLLCHNILNSDVNYGLKSDVLRYAILYQLGGVYVDCDVVPVTGFEEVMGAVGGMFAGAANVLGGGGEISNAVVGAERGHVVVENVSGQGEDERARTSQLGRASGTSERRTRLTERDTRRSETLHALRSNAITAILLCHFLSPPAPSHPAFHP